jgi:hypothetical protein
VKHEYTTEPTNILNDLTEFIFKHAKLMDFSEEQPNYWKTIVSAILSTSSYEHKVFKSNLDILIQENITETGVDPRIAGPPSHIADQVIPVPLDLKALAALKKQRTIIKGDPHLMLKTVSILKKRTNQKSSEVARLKKMPRFVQVGTLCASNEKRLEFLNNLSK